MSLEFLWCIPNQAAPGHRGDNAVENHNSLETLTSHAKALEEYGWAVRCSAPAGDGRTHSPSPPRWPRGHGPSGGIDTFILSAYPNLEEAVRVGEDLLPLLRGRPEVVRAGGLVAAS
jgi:hypothetical protein